VLQVAVTVARDFRLYDQPQLIAASLLHDSVEDHAIELAEVLTGKVHEDKGEARDTCFRGLKPLFGAETTAIIARLTNPIRVQLHKDKNATYRDHVVGAIASDISALIIKVADTLDNTRDSVIDAGTRNRLDKKYSTTIPVYIEALKKVDDLAMRPDVVQIILDRLSEAQKLVTQRLGTFACRATTSDDDFIPRVA
jgi:(p)ppGpp synthase/HD superfamily hydrolase